MKFGIGLGVLLAVLSGAALGAKGPVGMRTLEPDRADLRWTGRVCWMPAAAHFRLARLRDGGADRATAEADVERFLESLWNTGTHIVHRHDALVARASATVWEHRELTPSALYSYGYFACKVARVHGEDSPLAASMEPVLLQVVADCEKQSPGTQALRPLRECVARAKAVAPAT